jgi:hypothetical protein
MAHLLQAWLCLCSRDPLCAVLFSKHQAGIVVLKK